MRKTTPPTGSHVFQRTRTTFELNQHIIKTNILTKLHEDWACNVTSTVFTSFELDRDIIGTNVLTKFHDDPIKNVASRVFTRYLYSQILKTAPPTGGHTNILTNFEINRDIIGTKLLTKFHEDRKRNVPSRVFTKQLLTDGPRTDDGKRPVTKAHLSNQVSLSIKFLQILSPFLSTSTPFIDFSHQQIGSYAAEWIQTFTVQK
ncbi:hypothetical protein DPMN_184227 [Dreissena polymorpha]|uniref:Uncharacterized protein n=1 Tax=Dreissena polymorpha TaxID=45954 RepID=A0A9D4DHH0_DREPO|nr:hypothetical protein DPMN_184227 [Dreissena polymorpha]